MNLTDLSLLLIGKASKRKTVSLFFPNIPSKSRNILDINIKGNSISDSTLSRIINFDYSSNLRSNSINTTFIDILIKINQSNESFNSLLNAYTEIIDNIEDFSQNNNRKLPCCFKDCLVLIDKSKLIPTKYLNIITTYILNEKYNIVLFLMGSLLILSSVIKKKETFDENDIRYQNLNQALDIIQDFANYSKYLDTKNYLYQEYVPITQETLIQEETISFTSKYTNTRDDINRNYFVPLLKDNTCTELHILSRFANGWSRSEEYELLINRLEENTLIVKMLLMDINTSFANIYNDAQNHIEINPARIFENLAKKYPNNFFLRYVTVPLTNGIVHDVTNQKLRVDYLIIPPVSNKRLIHYFSKNNPDETLYYNQYSNQFDKIWNEYSKEVK